MAIKINFQDVLETTTAPAVAVGTRAETPDGRVWTYVQASTGGLAKGNVAVPAAATAVDNVSSSTDSQGRIVYITKASAGWTPGAFAGGYVVVDDGTGVGQVGQIMGNTADTLQLYPSSAFTTALSSVDSDITIRTPFLVVKALVTSLVQNAIGVAQVAFAASEYGYVLTQGVGTVIAGGVLVVGEYFATGDDTAGQVLAITNGETIDDVQLIGRALVANAAADQQVMSFINII